MHLPVLSNLKIDDKFQKYLPQDKKLHDKKAFIRNSLNKYN